jgi:hypothetical protein
MRRRRSTASGCDQRHNKVTGMSNATLIRNCDKLLDFVDTAKLGCFHSPNRQGNEFSKQPSTILQEMMDHSEKLWGDAVDSFLLISSRPPRTLASYDHIVGQIRNGSAKGKLVVVEYPDGGLIVIGSADALEKFEGQDAEWFFRTPSGLASRFLLRMSKWTKRKQLE